MVKSFKDLNFGAHDTIVDSLNDLNTTVLAKANQVDLDAANASLAEIMKQSSAAEPTTGTWQLGDKVWNSNPQAGGNLGWICVQAGTFGSGNNPVFKQFGIISA